MYLVHLTFKSNSGHVYDMTDTFDTPIRCREYIKNFPNVLKWSIHPLKELSPIESESKRWCSLNVLVTSSDGSVHRIDSNYDISDIQHELFNTLDLNNVKEIRIRFIR